MLRRAGGTGLYESTRTMNATEQLHAYQERTESLRRMVETRDLIIKDLEREIRELKAMLHGTKL